MGPSHPVLVFHSEHTVSGYNSKAIFEWHQGNVIKGSKQQERFDLSRFWLPLRKWWEDNVETKWNGWIVVYSNAKDWAELYKLKDINVSI